MSSRKVYFPNLHGLRFIAAFLVIIHHTEQIKGMSGIDNYFLDGSFISEIGHHGVNLFFVLSGFLITYLLLIEEQEFKLINIKNFYVRRILRIWPLYFLIVIFSFFILPKIFIFDLYGSSKLDIFSDFYKKIALYLIFLPNLAMSMSFFVPYASHLWSIGTEEQFYLIWPILFRFFKNSKLLVMCLIVFLYSTIKILLGSQIVSEIPYIKIIENFWQTFSIDSMAIGGIYALIYFYKMQIRNYFLNIYLFYLVLFFTLVLIIFGCNLGNFHNQFFSILYGLIILNLSLNEFSKINLENKIFIFLGNISYGLYMYHPIGIKIGLLLGVFLGLKTNFFFYPAILGITVLISTISYKYFESYFLGFKNKFSNIKSGSSGF